MPKQIKETSQVESIKHTDKKNQHAPKEGTKKRKQTKGGKSQAEKKYTKKLNDFSKRYPELKFITEMNAIKKEYLEMAEGLKQLRSKIVSMPLHYLHDIAKIEKTKRVKRTSRAGNGGFKGQHVLPDDLAEFLGYDTDEKTQVTIPELTKKFWEVVRTKQLVYEKDGRIFRPNAELKRIFDLPDSVDKSTDFNDPKGFNFTTLQRYFSKKLKDSDVEKVSADEEKPKSKSNPKDKKDKKNKKQKKSKEPVQVEEEDDESEKNESDEESEDNE